MSGRCALVGMSGAQQNHGTLDGSTGIPERSPMTQRRGSLARRLVAEFFVIVLGVLVALGVDGWRQASEDRRLEREYLERLATDLARDTLMINTRIELASSALAAGEAALAQLRAGRSLEGLLDGPRPVLGSSAAPIPNTATLDELKATGNLRMLTSSQVRQEILAYALIAASYTNRLENVMRNGRLPLAELMYTDDWTGDRSLLLPALVAANQYNRNFVTLLSEWKPSAVATLGVLDRHG